MGIVVIHNNGHMLQSASAAQAAPIASPDDIRLFDRDNIKRQGLDPNSKTRLEAAKTKHEAQVPFIAASRRGKNSQLAVSLRSLGGAVVFQADEVDYIRGVIPTDRAEQFAASDNLVDISIGEGAGFAPLLNQHEARNTPAARNRPNEYLPEIDPGFGSERADPDAILGPTIPPSTLNPGRPQASGRKHLPERPFPINDLKAINPYLPTYLMGAPQFIRRHPTFDGRGVTIALIGGVSDLDHSMLQYGRSLDGRLVSKVVDILDPSRRSMISVIPELLAQITAQHDRPFLFEGTSYYARRSGTYRIGVIHSTKWSRLAPQSEGIGVIWDETRNLVWIDTNGAHDFRTVAPITDFEIRQEYVRIPGEDDGLTASLSVKTYPQEHILKVFPYSDHETSVASVAAGNAFIGSQATGVAPAARILHVIPSTDAILESYLFAARDTRVDVISSSFDPDVSVEGENVASQIVNRIIQHYQKTIVKATGNSGAVVDSVYGMASPVSVLAIGGYSSRASEEANWTSPYTANEAEYVYQEGGSGPSGLGAVKPDLIAPSPNSRATPCAAMDESRSDFVPVRCNSMGGGQSSMAAPMAAGAVAILISAAKQVGLSYNSDRLRYALTASARHLENWPIDRQGGGAIQVGAAWEQLKSVAKKDLVQLNSAAPVSFVGRYNKTPGYGVGLYQLQGWHPGDVNVRDLVIFRTNGPTAPITYAISWIGNDSAFSGPSQVALGLRIPVSIPIHIEAGKVGIHSALLRLLNVDTGAMVGQFVTTVVVAEPLRAEEGYSVAVSGSISRNRRGRVFLDIPPHTENLNIAVTFTEGKGSLSVWREAEQLKCSSQSDAQCQLLALGPGVVQILIVGSDDQLPNSFAQQRFKVTATATVADRGR